MGNFFNSCHELSVVAKKARTESAKQKTDDKDVKSQKSVKRVSKETKELTTQPEKQKSLNKSESSIEEEKNQQMVIIKFLIKNYN